MIKIEVYDADNCLVTTIKNVKSITINPSYNTSYNIALITTLTYDLEHPYDFQTLWLKVGNRINFMED